MQATLLKLVKELITTQPVVPTTENGNGVTKQVYDRFGRVTWEMNQRGVITFMSYVEATGALLQRIEDVNTTLMSDAPARWVSEGEHLITDYVSDGLGWEVQQRGPWHEVLLREGGTTSTAIRRVEFTAFDANHETHRSTDYMMGQEPTAVCECQHRDNRLS